MIVTAPLPAIEKALPPVATASAASELATGFLRYASACWRGDRSATVFPLRLNAYWRPALPLAPVAVPDAVSPHGAAGRGIRWYQTGQDVLGYIPGQDGGFRVPVAAVSHLVRCAPVA